MSVASTGNPLVAASFVSDPLRWGARLGTAFGSVASSSDERVADVNQTHTRCEVPTDATSSPAFAFLADTVLSTHAAW